MLTTEQREHIVAVAESWFGTPYRPHSCLKGVGCDCGSLLKGVYEEAGFVPSVLLPENYSVQISQHKLDTTYIDIVMKYMQEITEAEVLPGDVVLYKMGVGVWAHAAIIKVWPEFVIHSLEADGVTGGHGMNLKFKTMERKFLTLRDEYCGGK
jgi:NlpC/P60 family putative phage cell wall peptidase